MLRRTEAVDLWGANECLLMGKSAASDATGIMLSERSGVEEDARSLSCACGNIGSEQRQRAPVSVAVLDNVIGNVPKFSLSERELVQPCLPGLCWRRIVRSVAIGPEKNSV